MTAQKNKKTVAPTYIEQNGGETPNKIIIQQAEKTWDGPLGEAIRNAGTGQGYIEPEAIPRPETVETGNQRPLNNPDEAQPQTQKPTVIQQPVAAAFEAINSEEAQEKSIEHSEENNVSHKRGYNEPKDE
ncbi:MAG: hypothetical protein V4585_17895 [Bacteroidota bacterium]|jgi:hypothetical protein